MHVHVCGHIEHIQYSILLILIYINNIYTSMWPHLKIYIYLIYKIIFIFFYFYLYN